MMALLAPVALLGESRDFVFIAQYYSATEVEHYDGYIRARCKL
jgi:hypothetical protein